MNLTNSYNVKIIGICLFVIFVLFVQCTKSITNTSENEKQIGEMTDIDGNVYKTIRIGDQIWMAENLRVTRYNDGKKINQISEIKEWGLDTIGAYCFYNNTKT